MTVAGGRCCLLFLCFRKDLYPCREVGAVRGSGSTAAPEPTDPPLGLSGHGGSQSVGGARKENGLGDREVLRLGLTL